MAKAKRKLPTITIVGPTHEQARRGQYERSRGSYRRVPVIDTMMMRGQIVEPEYRALVRYRDQAELAERSTVKSCLNDAPGGRGSSTLTFPAAVVAAQLDTARIESTLGGLQKIARAIALEDLTISQWCIRKYGSREKRDANDKFLCIVPIGERREKNQAIEELREAARVILNHIQGAH